MAAGPGSSALPPTIPVLFWALLLPCLIPCDSDNLLSPPPPRILSRPLPTCRPWSTWLRVLWLSGDPLPLCGQLRRGAGCCLAGQTPGHRTSGKDLCLSELCPTTSAFPGQLWPCQESQTESWNVHSTSDDIGLDILPCDLMLPAKSPSPQASPQGCVPASCQTVWAPDLGPISEGHGDGVKCLPQVTLQSHLQLFPARPRVCAPICHSWFCYVRIFWK